MSVSRPKRRFDAVCRLTMLSLSRALRDLVWPHAQWSEFLCYRPCTTRLKQSAVPGRRRPVRRRRRGPLICLRVRCDGTGSIRSRPRPRGANRSRSGRWREDVLGQKRAQESYVSSMSQSSPSTQRKALSLPLIMPHSKSVQGPRSLGLRASTFPAAARAPSQVWRDMRSWG